MSLKRWAVRRDRNEQELVPVARKLGWWLIDLDEPCDFVGWLAGQWHLVEIKRPEMAGKAREYTPAQKEFRAKAQELGARLLTWRTADDVIRDSQALRKVCPTDGRIDR